jgi:hypothetical protein
MAAKKNPAMDFIVESLRKNKDATYAEIADAAQKRGYTIYPIMFGRAQAMLGLVKVAPRGQGKAKAQASAARGRKAGGRGGPGRPARSASASGSSSLDDVISALKEGDRERDRSRRALEQIRSILQSL